MGFYTRVYEDGFIWTLTPKGVVALKEETSWDGTRLIDEHFFTWSLRPSRRRLKKWINRKLIPIKFKKSILVEI